MPTKSQVEDWAERYRQAWVEADAEAAAALFAEGATYRSNIFEPAHTGRDGVAGYWADVTSSQADVEVRMGSPIVDGSRSDVEFWTTMTSNGLPVTLAGCLLLEFDENGLCTSLREYWNFADESHDPPEEWGS